MCCCGLKCAGITSLIFLLISFIFCAVALSGREDSPEWAYLKIKKTGITTSCDDRLNFGTQALWGGFCTCSGGVCGTIDVDSFKYSDDDCNDDFCDDCERAGNAIIGLFSLCIVMFIGMAVLIFYRYFVITPRGGIPPGCSPCTPARLANSCIVTLLAIFLISGTSQWESCLQKIHDYGEDQVKNSASLTASSESANSGAYAVATLSWIFCVVVAGIECCALPNSREVEQLNAGGDGVVGVAYPA